MRPQTLLRAAALYARFERPVRSVLRAVIEPRKPRHRVLRVLLAAVGLVVLAGLLVVGLVLGTLAIVGGLAWRLLRPSPAPRTRPSRVFDADYRIVGRQLLPR
ncbi:hypothetical protein [Lysobacter humi (ex Lee et al. 2017)]